MALLPMSKRSLVYAVVLTIASSLLYAGMSRFEPVLTKYSWIILVIGVLYVVIQDRIERGLKSDFVKIVLRSVSFMVLSVAIYITAFKFVDGLWWIYLIVAGILFYNGERIASWLT